MFVVSLLLIGGSFFDGRYSGCGLSFIYGIFSSLVVMLLYVVMMLDIISFGFRVCSCGMLSMVICVVC